MSAFTLYLQLLDRYPLREDEALYSYWAQSIRSIDPLMRTIWPDKPPLYLWAQTAVFAGLGATQVTARLFNIAATMLTIATVAATGQRLWGRPAARLAAILFAFIPFTISFAATAYTDPLLVCCGQMALLMALPHQGDTREGDNRGKDTKSAFWVGVWLAAAIMTKQQGILYVPLVLFVLFWPTQQQATLRHKGKLGAWLVGMMIIILPILYWDSMRWSVAPSPWDLSVRNYGPITLAAPSMWLDRVRLWGALLWYVTSSNWVWIGYGLVFGIVLSRRLRWSFTKFRSPVRATKLLCTYVAHTLYRRRLPILAALYSWIGVYLLLHIVTTLQIWDRYLLPIIAPCTLLFAVLICRSYRQRPPAHSNIQETIIDWSIVFLLLLLLLPTAARAANGRFPIGGDRGAYAGLPEATEWIRMQDGHSILYHQRLGWHLQFYLFNELQQDKIALHWFANAPYLADNAAKYPNQQRYYVQPAWYRVDNFELHVAIRNMKIVQRARFGEMRIYEIINRPQPPCDWCLCQSDPVPQWLSPQGLPIQQPYRQNVPASLVPVK